MTCNPQPRNDRTAFREYIQRVEQLSGQLSYSLRLFKPPEAFMAALAAWRRSDPARLSKL